MYAPVYACLCAFVCLCAGPKGRPAKNAIHFVLTPEQQQLKKPPVVGGNLLKAPLCKQQKNQTITMLRKRSHRRAKSHRFWEREKRPENIGKFKDTFQFLLPQTRDYVTSDIN